MWEMFQIILNERKRRAIDPTLAILRQCAAEPVSTSAAEQYAHKRIKAMLVFFEETTFLYEEVRRMPVSALRQILRLKTQVKRLISGGAAEQEAICANSHFRLQRPYSAHSLSVPLVGLHHSPHPYACFGANQGRRGTQSLAARRVSQRRQLNAVFGKV